MEAINILPDLLGVGSDKAAEEVNYMRGLTVRLAWLKSLLAHPSPVVVPLLVRTLEWSALHGHTYCICLHAL
ncbi:hypothetical protein Scep_009853 [Stephania cephalantha]|uniref:Uncharacterized protein n=1 Tax=Stephania cephalantha TaxID=152367 RepID=A0AAP0JU04_9MAGN